MANEPRADRELGVVPLGLLGVVTPLLLPEKSVGFVALLGVLASAMAQPLT